MLQIHTAHPSCCNPVLQHYAATTGRMPPIRRHRGASTHPIVGTTVRQLTLSSAPRCVNSANRRHLGASTHPGRRHLGASTHSDRRHLGASTHPIVAHRVPPLIRSSPALLVNFSDGRPLSEQTRCLDKSSDSPSQCGALTSQLDKHCLHGWPSRPVWFCLTQRLFSM